MIRQNRQHGFSLQEVMISLAIMTILGVAAVPAIQKEMQSTLDEEGAASIEQLVSSYKQFRSTQRRNPSDLTELASQGTYQGSGVMPWGSSVNFSDLVNPTGAVKGAQFSFQAKDPAQAERLAGLLAKYNSVSAGSIVTLSTPISTIETIEDQMLCRTGLGPDDCNVMQVDLDAGSNDITGNGNFTGNIGEMNTVISDLARFGEFEVTEEIVLGDNAISSSGTTMSINAPKTSFAGDVSIQGDLTGNDSNISGVNVMSANSVIADTATIDTGVVSNLSGVSLDYEKGEFNNVTSQTTESTYGEFNDVNAGTVNADTVITNILNASVGTVNELSASNASGTNLNLSGLMDLENLESNTSSLGNASANYLNLSGDATGARAIFSLGNFNSLLVTGSVTGGDFTGNDFTTSQSSVNKNKDTIDKHASLISINATDNAANSSAISSLQTRVNNNETDIALNQSRILSNKTLAQNNASKISKNADSINVLEQRATSIESGVASLKNQLQTCESQGGCSW
ncbi:MAG: hypothetical protein CML20_18605 [Rheinheimera sp.]|nr:hypothetical protein [Rheinheimera sp.]